MHGRRAGDQVIQPVEVEQAVRPPGDQVAAVGPRRPGRTEAVGQEQHECPGPPPHQPLEADGPVHHHNLAAAREFPTRGYRPRGSVSVICPFKTNGSSILATITYTAPSRGFKTV